MGASIPAPANFFKLGQVWKLRVHWTYLHTAASTPSLTTELAVAGAAIVVLVVTPVAVAGTYHGAVEAYFTMRGVGVSGSLMGSVHLQSHALTLASAGAGPATVNTTPTTIDTTIARLVELRMRMTTAVAANTLTLSQGWAERVVG